jgi:hypothetical protein
MENDQLPALSDILNTAQATGVAPEQTAAGILQWRADARGELQKAVTDPEHFFQSADLLDKDVSNALKSLQKAGVQKWAETNFGDDQDGASKFFAAYRSAPDQAGQMNPTAKDSLDSILQNPAFALPRASNQWFPLKGGAGNDLGTYKVQAGTDGKMDVLVNIHNPQPEPNKAERMMGVISNQDAENFVPDVKPFVQGTLRVPQVTDDDLKKEISETKGRMETFLARARDTEALPDDQDLPRASQAMPAKDAALRESARLQELSGPGGKGTLAQERIAEAFKNSPLAKQAGQWGLLEDAQRAVAGMALNLQYAVADTLGDEGNKQRIDESLKALPDVLPGTTAPTWWGEHGRSTVEFASTLPMIMNPAGAVVLAASTYGGSVHTANDAADAADQQASALQNSHPEMSAQFADMAQRMRGDARIYGALSAATVALAGKLVPEAKGFLKTAAREGAVFGGMTAVQGQVLDPIFTGKRGDPMDILESMITGTVMGGAHAAVNGAEPEKAAAPAAQAEKTQAAPEAKPAPVDDVLVPAAPPPEPPVPEQEQEQEAPPEPQNAPPAASEPPPDAQTGSPPAPNAPAGPETTPAAPPEPRTVTLQEARNRRIENLSGETPTPEMQAVGNQAKDIQIAKDVALTNNDPEAAAALAEAEQLAHSKLAELNARNATEPKPEPTPPNDQHANQPNEQGNVNADQGGQVAPSVEPAPAVAQPTGAGAGSPSAPPAEPLSLSAQTDEQIAAERESQRQANAPEPEPAPPPPAPPAPPDATRPAPEPHDPEKEIRLAHADEAAREVAAGRTPLENVPQGTKAAWNERAQQRIAAGEGPALVRSLNDNPRVATPVEHFMLIHYAEHLERASDEAAGKLADPNLSDGDRERFGATRNFAEQEREQLAIAANRAGSKAGAALGARAMSLVRDEIPKLPADDRGCDEGEGFELQGTAFTRRAPSGRRAPRAACGC